jgi:hypothetical protein
MLKMVKIITIIAIIDLESDDTGLVGGGGC